MASYKVQVYLPIYEGNRPTGEYRWEYGRPSVGPDYQYTTKEQAIAAARFWGDVYDMGEVRVVKIHK